MADRHAQSRLAALFAAAGFPPNVVAAKTDLSDDIATIAHVGEWRIGIHTGIKGGNYRDTDLGNDAAQAQFLAAVINSFVQSEKGAIACHHGWRGSGIESQIATPCPACGAKSLFIGEGGHLTCARVPTDYGNGCDSPSVEETIADLKRKLANNGVPGNRGCEAGRAAAGKDGNQQEPLPPLHNAADKREGQDMAESRLQWVRDLAKVNAPYPGQAGLDGFAAGWQEGFAAASVPSATSRTLPYVVEYRRKDVPSAPWEPMAAFDIEGAAENYARQCSGDGVPWEYRVTPADRRTDKCGR